RRGARQDHLRVQDLARPRRPARAGDGLVGRAAQPDADALRRHDAGDARRKESRRLGPGTEDHHPGSHRRLHERLGVRRIPGRRQGHARARQARRSRDPQRRRAHDPSGRDQGRQGADDRGRRHGRAPAQAVMTRTRAAALVAAALSIAVLYAGLRLGALVAGGSDSYGYVSEAGLWRHGLPIVHQDIVRISPWPRAAQTWTPLGYRASPKLPDAIVPVYAPGLPLLMALLQAIAGSCGAFLVVPLCGALTICLTFVLGRRLFEAPAVPLLGAGLVATSPVFLYQLMNAMSDVPVTAAWTLALVLAVIGWPLASGIAMSVAIAIRPNLAPLAALLAVWIAFTGGTPGESRYSGHRFVRFLLGVAPSVLGIGWLNAQLYESP